MTDTKSYQDSKTARNILTHNARPTSRAAHEEDPPHMPPPDLLDGLQGVAQVERASRLVSAVASRLQVLGVQSEGVGGQHGALELRLSSQLQQQPSPARALLQAVRAQQRRQQLTVVVRGSQHLHLHNGPRPPGLFNCPCFRGSSVV